jgi:archaellum component FlaC
VQAQKLYEEVSRENITLREKNGELWRGYNAETNTLRKQHSSQARCCVLLQ